jgi:hypothetical protein
VGGGGGGGSPTGGLGGGGFTGATKVTGVNVVAGGAVTGAVTGLGAPVNSDIKLAYS